MTKTFRPRELMKRLHAVMAGSGSRQDRLNAVVQEIAANMFVEVCSVYLTRSDNVLELFAAFGLKQEAVHKTQLKMGEGVVGLIAREAIPFNLSEASDHPKFIYLPETGEERFHSLMGVPIIRGGKSAGVLVVQSIEQRYFTDEEIEVLQTVAMVLAELLASGGLVRPEELKGSNGGRDQTLTLSGQRFADGLARGKIVFHEPKVDIVHAVGESEEVELERLEQALKKLHEQLDRLTASAAVDGSDETKEILETYKMFAYDRGWQEKIIGAIKDGLTAEAAVERIQQDLHGRLTHTSDPYLRERLSDLEDLSHRLIRILLGYYGEDAHHKLSDNSILVARTMGPAELLDYDRNFLKGIVLEEGTPTSHVSIIAKALGIPMLGRVRGILVEADEREEAILDAVAGRIVLHPSETIIETYGKSLEEREQLQQRYLKQRELPSITKDGKHISLQLNAGLTLDLANLKTTGADGIGLFRTEFQFMVSSTLPRMEAQTKLYSRVLQEVDDKPVVFRTLDVGADKHLPFLPHLDEENPAMGWRGVRMGLDRPALLRYQIRALLAASKGKQLDVMFPMISTVEEFMAVRKLVDKEVERLEKLGKRLPRTIHLGSMLEVPSLMWDLDRLLEHADFISVGTNDLMQFFYASDRGNPMLADRYSFLSTNVLKLLKSIADKCNAADVPLTVCGEMAGNPIEAMALIGLGIYRLSMSAGALGPVKLMLRHLDTGILEKRLDALMHEHKLSIRDDLVAFANEHNIAV